MHRLRLSCEVISLMKATLTFCLPSLPSSVLATPFEVPDPCSLGNLPSEIQNRLKEDFGSWKAQASENLSERARQTWDGKKPPGCPGIAVGLFQNVDTPSYALLLVPVDHPDSGYRFVVFSRNTGQSTMLRQLLRNSTVTELLIILGVKSFASRSSTPSHHPRNTAFVQNFAALKTPAPTRRPSGSHRQQERTEMSSKVLR
jgi:hypothetical protein